MRASFLLTTFLVLNPWAASADSVSAVMGVTQIVPVATAICTVGTANVVFPPSIGAGVTAEGTVTVNCTSGASYSIAIDGGSNAQGTQRRLKRSGSSETKSYDLYQDAPRTTPWGDGGVTAIGNEKTGLLGTGSEDVHLVYATAPAFTLSSAPSGTYADIVTATVNF